MIGFVDPVKVGVDAASVAEYMMEELSTSDQFYTLEDEPVVENDSAEFTFSGEQTLAVAGG